MTTTAALDRVLALIDDRRDEIIDFASRLIQQPAFVIQHRDIPNRLSLIHRRRQVLFQA